MLKIIVRWIFECLCKSRFLLGFGGNGFKIQVFVQRVLKKNWLIKMYVPFKLKKSIEWEESIWSKQWNAKLWNASFAPNSWSHDIKLSY